MCFFIFPRYEIICQNLIDWPGIAVALSERTASVIDVPGYSNRLDPDPMPAPELGLCARAIVDRVVDGDTLDVLITIPARVRLLDCWAPETHGAERPQGEIAKALLESIAPHGTKVRVQVPTTHVDALGGVLTFGRVLGNVWVQGDGESLSEMMVNAGAATREKVKP